MAHYGTGAWHGSTEGSGFGNCLKCDRYTEHRPGGYCGTCVDALEDTEFTTAAGSALVLPINGLDLFEANVENAERLAFIVGANVGDEKTFGGDVVPAIAIVRNK